MLVRQATIDDAESIAQVHVRSWQETYPDLLPESFLNSLSVPKRLPLWMEILSNSAAARHLCVALDRQGGVCGFAHIGPSRDAAMSGMLELYAIYVLQKDQGRGVGREMLRWLAQSCAQHAPSPHRVYAWVLRGNKSAGWYQRIGGRRVDEKPITIADSSLWEDAYAFWLGSTQS